LVAPAVDIAQEIYLGVTLDRARRQNVVMASAEGGVDIEEVARDRPERIVRALVDPFLGLHAWQARQIGFALGLATDRVAGFATIARQLYDRRRNARRDQPTRPDREWRLARTRRQDDHRRQRVVPSSRF
jgi:succinyl-CoA synthetase beta subunit